MNFFQSDNFMSLRVASISSCNFSNLNSIITALQNNDDLTEFYLDDCSMMDEATGKIADALLTNNRLSRLTLNNSQISDSGATCLANAIRVNNTLKIVYLNNNEIGKNGANAIANALHENISIILLDISGNNIDKKILDDIMEQLKINRLINLLSKTGFISSNSFNQVLKLLKQKNNSFTLSPLPLSALAQCYIDRDQISSPVGHYLQKFGLMRTPISSCLSPIQSLSWEFRSI